MCSITTPKGNSLNDSNIIRETMMATKDLQAIEECIHHAFEAQVRKSPYTPAIKSWDGELNYLELNELASLFAYQLAELGVGPEKIIALIFDKSMWAVVAMLAVLKAGGACLNLSPTQPLQRLESVINKSKALMIVTSPSHMTLARSLSIQVTLIDELRLKGFKPKSRKLPHVVPNNPAYVLFTSGSSGEPKGIIIEHRSLRSSSEAHGRQWNIEPGTRVFQFAAFTFDVSVADIFTSLCRGACICMPNEQERVEALGSAIRRYKANWIFLTPSVARTLRPSAVPDLGILVLGGEPATKQLIEDWADHVKLIICYGPAECSVYCSGTSPVHIGHDPLNIGSPIGCRIYIVDPDNPNILLRQGTIGEILVEGPIVARGYVGEAVANHENFLTEAPWLCSGQRNMVTSKIYRTGDLGRLNQDGSINIEGRKDMQVKVRGQRVELGEIEYHLKSLFQDCNQVVAHTPSNLVGGSSPHELIAFIAGQGSEINDNGINGWAQTAASTQLSLSRTLPSYMIPTLLIPLSTVPLTLNGKADRRKLDEIYQEHRHRVTPSLDGARPEALSPEETLLCTLWSRVLGIDHQNITPDCSFLDFGGDSIKAMRLIGEAQDSGWELGFGTALNSPSLKVMAKGLIQSEIVETSKPPDPFSLISSGQLPSMIARCGAICGVAPEAVEDIYPSTPLQESLMVSKKHDEYISTYVLDLPLGVSIDRMKYSWETAYESLEILRTRLVYVSGYDTALQVVITGKVEWEEDDSVESSRRSFGRMAYGKKLSRLAITRRNPRTENPCILWTIHHSLIDAISVSFIFDLVAATYNGADKPLIVPFKSYIAHLSSTSQLTSSNWWREYLDQAPSPDWPIINQTQTTKVETSTYSFTHPSPTNRDFTVATCLKAAWAYLISTYSCSHDVVFASTHAGRSIAMRDILSVAGPTISTVPFRVVFDEDQTLGELLKAIQYHTSQMSSHDHLGLQTIKNISPSANSASRIRSLLVIQPPQEPSKLEALSTILNESIESVVGTYPLTLECKQKQNGVDLILNFQSNIVSGDQASRILQQMANNAAKFITGTSDSLVFNDHVRTPDSWEIVESAALQQQEYSEVCIHDRFRERVKEQPSAAAVTAWDARWDYETLDTLSTTLAYKLRDLGVLPGSIVPICSPKSGWVIVSMLAVLKAGAAFLPLDASNPPDRLQNITKRLKAELILTGPDNTLVFSGIAKYVFDMTSIASKIIPKATESLPVGDPKSLAYLIFTSGSTGEPKGVELEHRSYCTAALARASLIYRTESSRVFQFSSYGFDTSIEDIFTTLLTGGCICVPSESDRRSNFTGSFNELGANCADITPSLAHVLNPEDLPGLETLILGGEPMSSSLVQKWANGRRKLINTYGPTECAIVTTVTKPLQQGWDENNIGNLPCGRAWIVSPHNHHRLLPTGAIGELIVEGELLARGYYNDVVQTERAFVTNVGWASPERRFYKTGDLAKFSEVDSSVVFVGRKDSQVKIRGQRVELTEVAAHVQRSSNAISVVTEFLSLQKFPQALIAFLAFENSTLESLVLDMAEELRSQIQECERDLREKIPSYMVPSIFIPLTAIPTTRSGKVDHALLKTIATSLSKEQLLKYRLVESKFSEPLKESSHILLGSLWARVLNIDVMSLHVESEFFKVGGDSLSAMRLSALSKEANFGLTVADIFRYTTICDMASRMEAGTAKIVSSYNDPPVYSLLPSSSSISKIIQKQNLGFSEEYIEDMYPCTAIQEAMMALSAKQPRSYVLRSHRQLRDGVDLDRLRRSWDQVIHMNPILRTRIIFDSDVGSIQVVLKSRFQDKYSSSHPKLMTMSYKSPLHVVKFSSINGKNFITQAIHHAIFDAESLEMINKQVVDLYNGRQQDQVQISFAQFVSFLQTGEDKTRQQYWQNQLEGNPSTEFYATGSSQRLARQEQFMKYEIPFEGRSHISATSSGFTIPLLIRAAWALTISAFTNSDDVLFGLNLSGRTAPIDGISTLVAPTMTTVPLRVRLNKMLSVFEFLGALKRQAADMIQFEHTGLQHVQRYISKTLELSNILVIQQATSTASEYDKLLWDEPQTIHEAIGSTDYYTNDLVLECNTGEKLIELMAIFDSSYIQEQQLKHMLSSFAHIVKQLCHLDKRSKIADLLPCDSNNFEQILQWNLAAPGRHEEKLCIQDLIHQHSKNTPDKIAVTSWDGSMTFEELRIHTDNLARYLSNLEIFNSNVVVIPVFFDKSIYAIIAMIAVIKAGGAYTALDSSHPVGRLRDMVRQVRAQICLVSSENEESLIGAANQVTVIDAKLLAGLKFQDLPALRRAVTPDDAAIIVFTSGSTGRPKPITLSHKAITSCAKAFGPDMNFSPESRVLSNAAYAFDIHACEIFLTLTHGGTLFLTNEDRSNLAEVISDWKINWLFSTPSALDSLPGPESIPSVKTLMMIGEVPSRQIYSRWFRKGLRLINAYGPAENTLFSTMAVVQSPDQDPTMIGFPYNTALWIVNPDDHAQLSPIGAIGELLLQGDQLAAGYLYEEEKTAAAFIQSPKWMRSQIRQKSQTLYKTGDLCQFNFDGSLRIVGRKDSQVKLRGQRLEIGEVEFHLRKTIKSDLAVDCVSFPSGRQALVAFMVSSSPKLSTFDFITIPTELFKKQCLQAVSTSSEYLPTFMIPSFFIPIQSLPRTASLKLDRKLLRSLVIGLSEDKLNTFALQGTEGSMQPTTKAGIELQELWSEILGVERRKIGVESNFFALGGDSILSVKLAVAFRNNGRNKVLSVIDIFRFPTLSKMANRIREGHGSFGMEVQPFTLLGGADTSELLSQLQQIHGFNRDDVQDMYPCTPLQEGFMLATARNCHAYVSHQVFSIATGLDLEKLRSTFEGVIRQHDILRTTIVQLPSGDLWQVVRSTALNCQLVSSTSLSTYLQDTRKHAMAYGEPMFKICLVEWKVVITSHHSVFDAWSMSNILNEVRTTYQDLKVPKAVQFKSFVHHTQTTNKEDSRNFWEKYLSGSTTSQIFLAPGAGQFPRLEKSTCRSFSLLSEPSNRMYSTVARAAWAVVLSLYSESPDVSYGTILNGRSGDASNSSFDAVAGPTVTTVPFRVQIEAGQAVGDLLRNIQEVGISMLPHQHIGLDNIRKLNPDASLAASFDSILDIVIEAEESPEEKIIIPENSLKLSQASSYYMNPLVVLCTFRKGGNVSLEATYDSNIISSEKSLQILAQFELVLSQLASVSPNIKLSKLQLLTEQEAVLIKTWNSWDPEKSADQRCIHNLFKETVTRQPEASAIEAWDGSVSYRELDDLSSTLAQHLIQLGVGPKDKIPLCFDKSLWTPIAMLGCLKAGAAYVPLDPSHPTQRLHTIVRFVGSDVMIAGNTQIERFRGAVGNLILLDRISMDAIPASSVPLERRGAPEDTAIVVFTSGSTGMPKGVKLSHISFCTLALEVRDSMDFTKIENLRVLQFAAYAFDVSNAETFLTLIYGGALCIISDEEKQNNLAGAINRLRINWLYLTPTATTLVDPKQVPELRTLILGGEAGSRDIVTTWAPHVHLVNSFGPAEGGIWPSMSHLRVSSSHLNIGRSAGTRLWLVHPDNHDQLMGPIGAVGELLLEGPMLASGYLHEPEKTAFSFLGPPSWGASFEASGVFYKTGDLCRYNPDGSMSYVARKDGQVKLRGQRLDLGEVEHAIKTSLGQPMRVAAEIVHFSDRKDSLLAAFICSKVFSADHQTQEAFTKLTQVTGDLQSRLHQVLPSYMVPSFFIPLQKMPLTVSGKRDRKTLKQIASEMSFVEMASKGAQLRREISTDMEIKLRQVWATVLKIEPKQIFASDNFMKLGGNSIDAMRIVFISNQSKFRITMVEVLRSADLSEMANYCRPIQDTVSSEVSQSAVASVPSAKGLYPELLLLIYKRLGITADGIEDVVEAGDFQSHCFYYGMLSSRGTANYLSFTFPKGIDASRMQAACEHLITRYPMLRTTFMSYRQSVMQIILKSWKVDIERLTDVEDGALCRDGWIAKDKARPSTLDQPLTRGAIIQCKNDSAIFIIQQSHTRNDAWSDHHFCTDLATAYQGQKLPLRPTFTQFRRHIDAFDRNQTETYWRNLLNGSRMSNIVAHQSPSYNNIINITLEKTIPSFNTSHLGVTTASVLKAAWALVLAEYTQESDVVFGHLTSGRSLPFPGIEEIFGPCLNIVPVRMRLGNEQRISTLIQEAQAQHVTSLEYEWIDGSKIMANCTNWTRNTRFSSVVQYQNINEIQSVDLNGLKWDVQLHAVDYDSSDIWILAWPEDQGVKVTLCFSENTIARNFASRMLDRFCHIMELLVASKNQELPIPISNGVSALLPIAGPRNNEHLSTYHQPGGLPSQCIMKGTEDIVTLAWTSIWDGINVSEFSQPKSDVPFYEVTGSSWVATQLTMEYRGYGIELLVEDIINNPTMESQTILLARKRQEKVQQMLKQD